MFEMSHARLLILHPDPTKQELLRSMLFAMGDRIEEADNDRAAVRALEKAEFDLVLAYVDPADPDALELLTYIRRKHPKTAVILLFAAPHPERTREALHRGAVAVLRFPLPANELRATVAQAIEPLPARPGPRSGNGPAPAEPATRTNGLALAPVPQYPGPEAPAGEPDLEPMLGDDPSLRQVIELAGAIAPAKTPVLLTGERGTGKSLLARTIHGRSTRRGGPLVEVVCDGQREGLLERELFGQATGDFPGSTRPGKLAQADGGTLILSEVGALTPELQFKLLRVLEQGQFEPVGSTQTVRVDVRFILTTSEDLAELVAQGRFRQDLFYRIGVVGLKLPPLRQRPADILTLAEHFRARFAHASGQEAAGFTAEAIELLRRHPWPGNVRELEQAIERGVVLCRGGRIAPTHLALGTEPPRPVRAGYAPRPHVGVSIRPLKEALEGPEKQIILQALEALNWNRQETARMLDINRTTLYKKMKKYGLLLSEPAWS
jgi:two-component system response regulator HydG